MDKLEGLDWPQAGAGLRQVAAQEDMVGFTAPDCLALFCSEAGA
jgi:hypothetical protein